MKIKVTEIECNAEELRQSNSVADAFTNILWRVFTPYSCASAADEDEDEAEQ